MGLQSRTTGNLPPGPAIIDLIPDPNSIVEIFHTPPHLALARGQKNHAGGVGLLFRLTNLSVITAFLNLQLKGMVQTSVLNLW